MSPDGLGGRKRTFAFNDLYTVVLAVAFCVVLFTLAFVALKCYLQYGTIFTIP